MSFEPKIVAYVCNWCTYLGADLAGTTRLEYPSNVRIIRLPCTGRIDFNLIVKAFEIGADAVLVSGCHPGDCHYTSGNYHARRRWMLFRDLLDTLGFDLERIHFTWISAAEGHKWQQVITEITAKTRALGPYQPPQQAPLQSIAEPLSPAEPRELPGQSRLRESARRLLSEKTVNVVIGFGTRGPVFLTTPEESDRLVWNDRCLANLTVYLKRKEVRALGKPALVVKGCDERALVVLEKEAQFDRRDLYVIGMACPGMGQPKCNGCEVSTPRFADEVIGEAAPPGTAAVPDPLACLLEMPPAQRLAWWAGEFARCTKCYACRQVCPLCYCERCLVDKNRPTVIDTSPTLRGNFAWQIMRAFHLAGRCVGCDACTEACPAGIDLRLLNQSLARSAKRNFGYRAGMQPEAEPVVGSWSAQDKEAFIR